MKTVVIESLFYLILTSYSHIKNRARDTESHPTAVRETTAGGALVNPRLGSILESYSNIITLAIDMLRVTPGDDKVSQCAQLQNIRKALSETFVFIDSAERALLKELQEGESNG